MRWPPLRGAFGAVIGLFVAVLVLGTVESYDAFRMEHNPVYLLGGALFGLLAIFFGGIPCGFLGASFGFAETMAKEIPKPLLPIWFITPGMLVSLLITLASKELFTDNVPGFLMHMLGFMAMNLSYSLTRLLEIRYRKKLFAPFTGAIITAGLCFVLAFPAVFADDRSWAEPAKSLGVMPLTATFMFFVALLLRLQGGLILGAKTEGGFVNDYDERK